MVTVSQSLKSLGYSNYEISAEGRVWSCKRKNWLRGNLVGKVHRFRMCDDSGIWRGEYGHLLYWRVFHGEVPKGFNVVWEGEGYSLEKKVADSKRKLIPESKREEILNWQKNGLSVVEISQRLDVSRWTVYRFLAK